MVPFLYLLYDRIGLSTGEATPLAHATSLAVIVPAALRSLAKYRGSGQIRWEAAAPMAITTAIAAAITAPFAARLPGHSLRLGFGVFLVLLSIDLIVMRGGAEEMIPEAKRKHMIGAALIGLPVGALSAALGIGGGVPASAGMHYLLKLPFRMIAATSLVVVLFAAVAGTASYMLVPSALTSSPWVIGHVDFERGLPLAIGAVLFAPFGVRVNRQAPVTFLRRAFGVLLLVTGGLLVWENL